MPAKKLSRKPAAKKAAKKPAKPAKKPAKKSAKAKAPKATKAAKPAKAAAAPAAPVPGQDALALLLRSVEEFNAWRLAHLDAPVDLRGADLRGANLSKAFLPGALLDGAKLDDAGLIGALLSGASLVGASLRRADLRGSCFGRGELIESSLALSPVGGALVRGAVLRDASLEGARAQEAVFLEADLSGADLTDCDLRGANLTHALLDGTKQTELPPPPDDTDTIFARLAKEPREVRLGLALFAGMTFLAGDRGQDGQQMAAAIVEGLGLTQDDLNAIMPKGTVQLETLSLQPPASQWARRVTFALMCGLASTSAEVAHLQLQVLGHFGEQLGYTDRAMARIIGDELGVSIQTKS